MEKRFSCLATPVIAGIVKENTPVDARAEIRNCECHGATAVDLHLSCLAQEYKNEQSIRNIISESRLPVLALNYNLAYEGEWHFYESTEEERTELLLTAAKAGAAAVDIQGYTFDLGSKNGFRNEFSHLGYSFIKGNPKEIVVDSAVIEKQMEFIEKAHALGAEVLLSNHPGIPMTAEQVVELALFLEKRKPDVIKIVTVANNEEEMVEAFKAMTMLKKELKTPVSYHCSGKSGGLTRVVNPALGGFMCFCNDRYVRNADFAQPLVESAKVIFENLKNIM